jgi:hypothetical protein
MLVKAVMLPRHNRDLDITFLKKSKFSTHKFHHLSRGMIAVKEVTRDHHQPHFFFHAQLEGVVERLFYLLPLVLRPLS